MPQTMPFYPPLHYLPPVIAPPVPNTIPNFHTAPPAVPHSPQAPNTRKRKRDSYSHFEPWSGVPNPPLVLDSGTKQQILVGEKAGKASASSESSSVSESKGVSSYFIARCAVLISLCGVHRHFVLGGKFRVVECSH